MMGTILGFLGSTIGKYAMVALIGSLVIGGALAWHKMNFVSREAMEQWKRYSQELSVAVDEREKKLQRYQDALGIDDEKIENLEAQREKLLREDRERDNPVLLDSDDTRGLHDFGESAR